MCALPRDLNFHLSSSLSSSPSPSSSSSSSSQQQQKLASCHNHGVSKPSPVHFRSLLLPPPIICSRSFLPPCASISAPNSRSFLKGREKRRSCILASAQTSPPYSSSSLDQRLEYDVVIVGAGIIGLSIAHRILSNTHLSVALVDAARPCSGATGAG